jgi:Transposase C of IS166 homeodomain
VESVSYSELPPTNLVELLHEKDREIEKLHLLLIQANKRQFGQRSEKLSLGDDVQPGLFSFEAPTSSVVEPETVEVESHTRLVRRGRKPLPDNLPRHRIEHPPETTHCSCCNEKLTCLMARSPRSSSSLQLGFMSTSTFA